jgi:hypothetical protein
MRLGNRASRKQLGANKSEHADGLLDRVAVPGSALGQTLARIDNTGDAESPFSRNEMVDDITLYWLTNAAASSVRLYRENANKVQPEPGHRRLARERQHLPKRNLSRDPQLGRQGLSEHHSLK